MGNRAVITTKDNYENNGIGIYLHWNGGRDSVTAFLTYARMRGFRAPEKDNYGWARLCQVIANFFGGDLSIGIDTCRRLDCDNWDNGTYFIEDWKIVGRADFNRDEEQNEYNLPDAIVEIDACQPVCDQMGEEAIRKWLDEHEDWKDEMNF